MSGNGAPPGADKNLGEIVAEVSEKASQLVRQEIELAKAEVTSKVSKLTRGAAVAGAASVFLIFGITMFFHTLAWFLYDLFDFGEIWYGFAIVTGILFLLAILAGFIAFRLFKKGAPPTPDMAIEEAKLVRADFEAQAVQRDQLERSNT
jgi:uncharacterized membrane protein YqjE